MCPLSDTQETGTQTDLTADCIDHLVTENAALRKALQYTVGRVNLLQMTEDSLASDDRRIKFYTGLRTYAILLALFNFLERGISHGPRNSLSKFQEFMLTLVRLRLGVPIQDLAFRFGVRWNLETTPWHEPDLFLFFLSLSFR